MAETFSILLSAGGRRMSLMRILQQSVSQLGFQPRIVATDITTNSPVMRTADVSRVVPRLSDPSCLSVMLALCKELDVRLIVPTIDPDLPFLARHREAFEAIGTRVMVSSPELIAIANNKLNTNQWLIENNFPTVRQIDAQAFMQNPSGWAFPLFAKPRAGSASIGAQRVNSIDELRTLVRDTPYLVQEIATGIEYTVDVFVDRHGKCRCAVPRRRLETRSGEVSKGITVRCEPVSSLASWIAERLPGAFGVMNIQIFYDAATERLNVIEINPRFGGGHPLAHQAGATMAKWLLEEILELPGSASNDTWQENLLMLRYDEAVFVPNASIE